MRQYILRRVLLVVPTILGVTILVSLLTELLPGDFLDILLQDHVGQGEDIEEYRNRIEEELGLNKSWPEQYGSWLWNLVQGDLGTSLHGSFRTVWEEVESRLPVTLELGVLALIVGVAIALPVGIVSAVRQGAQQEWAERRR